jgi:hypothetical protein
MKSFGRAECVISVEVRTKAALMRARKWEKVAKRWPYTQAREAKASMKSTDWRMLSSVSVVS